MGIPKHGKDSAKYKAILKYKSEGRYEKNKARKAKKNEKRLARLAAKKESKNV
jgi:hypothetical protein